MTENIFTNEEEARVTRRALINSGASVSLIAFDPQREVFVFDCTKREI